MESQWHRSIGSIMGRPLLTSVGATVLELITLVDLIEREIVSIFPIIDFGV
jgi:hypothetical protein